MNKQTLFFYDLETTGRSPRDDRIMQFAGQRTDLDLNPIGEPVNLLLKTPNDTLPSPIATSITHITPQSTQADGLTEAEFAHYVEDEIFTENTIIIGFNSVRFDDEFMRHLFWRTFFDPYEWQWRDGRSRWDLLDFVRITRALRPEGINWPVKEDGRPTNRLELITHLNGIEHEHAHDALADVFATISVAKLIKEKQPHLYDYMFAMRDKRAVKKLINLDNPTPFVYASGRYFNAVNSTTIAYPIAPGKNGNVLVYDLRFDPEEKRDSWYPIVKELAYNKCPSVAPISVLEAKNSEGKSGWDKLQVEKSTIEANLEKLLRHPELIDTFRDKTFEEKEWGDPFDPESALYSSFTPDADKVRINAVRNADATSLADFHPNFVDERLSDLLLHYKAKNFPTSLSESEVEEWEKYRQLRLSRQEPMFLKELKELEDKGEEEFIVEELKLWYQSLAPEY